MPEKTPRQRRRERRLRNIKDEALNLVVEKGVGGFSVNKLAARVDLTPGALYRYFDGRDEILISIQQEVLEGFDRYLAAILERFADRDELTKFVLLSRGYMALESLQPERFRLISQLVAFPDPVFDDELMMPALGVVERLLGRLARVIEAAEEKGVLTGGSAMKRAVVAWSSVQGLVERRKLARLLPETFDVSRLADDLLATLLRGWGATEDGLQKAIDDETGIAVFEEVLIETRDGS